MATVAKGFEVRQMVMTPKPIASAYPWIDVVDLQPRPRPPDGDEEIDRAFSNRPVEPELARVADR
ncbi:hypothetical protein MMUC44124_26585 [Mycolicibacterium mucogenicum DSM 44124]|nr:hypothetical protein MMUC44124_26585 [Mycolicibacterium mucogenicum DSM 44124]